ncbi:thiamine phosphate synthase [Alistipes sp. An66]|uniref:thiamine phosphate synthase n=1 Tax=Alistipes sp. An66 TaxID=1965650 RepID=UPI001EF73A4C|nr:thiamine phosphate synthase [Alistipes sp. An66]
MMRIVVITSEPFAAGEAEVIRRLLDAGIDRIHVRKPGAGEEPLRRLIESLPEAYYPRLSLHDRLPLAAEYGLGGVHLNGRNPMPPAGFRGLVSRSCHTPGELAEHAADTDYRFLSPIFDSISKSGYRAAFSDADLHDAAAQGVIDTRTYALGGVRPDLLPRVRAWGFGGAALLGCIWRDTSAEGLRRTLAEIDKYRKE